MALAAGTKLGPYEILAALGAGGMGEVYRARDTRLGRDVAIKVLPQHLSSNPELKARFEREAKTISALSHPHICHLYDVGSQGETDFLVMELLEGETLADRLQRGATSLKQTLEYGAQIASALEKAHKSGIVHRDLKPGNIMLTKSGAKLLDFGLARPVTTAVVAAAVTVESESKPLTGEGRIVGTYQYMAPEQIRGQVADARTDIFALGCTLYEMVTGKRAFKGGSQITVMGAILEHAPEPISGEDIPAALVQVIETCLAKDPDERWQSAADVARQLRWIEATPARTSTEHSRVGVAIFAGGAILLAVILGSWWESTRKSAASEYEFEITAPDKWTFNTVGLGGAPAISPDGKAIVFPATSASGGRLLWVRDLHSAEPRLLAGTDEATFPFWSPDGSWIGFFTSAKLKKIEANGGVAEEVCDVAEGRGGSWTRHGTIIFGVRDGPLYEVNSSGGAPTAITRFDGSEGEGSHRFPVMLPDDRHFLYVTQANQTELLAGSLESKKKLAEFPAIDASAGFSQGNLFFVRGNTLFAQPFDPEHLKLSGDPAVVAEKVEQDPQFNYSSFSVSEAGTLVFQRGQSGDQNEIAVVDRGGKRLGTVGGIGHHVHVNLSPSGKQLLVEDGVPAANKRAIWLVDVVAGTRTRLTFSDLSSEPVWSHDGRKIAVDVTTSQIEGHIRDLATGVDTKLFSTQGESLMEDWSPDGRYVTYNLHGLDSKSKWEIWAAETGGQHRNWPLLRADRDVRFGRLSWDGHWIAYVGLDTGRPEVYVSPIDFSADPPRIGSNKWQISTDGGNIPVWSRDGQELFFTNAPGTMLFAVPITKSGGSLQAGTAKKLFDFSIHLVAAFYDISPDGKKFYIAEAPQGSSAVLRVMTNWRTAMKQQ